MSDSRETGASMGKADVSLSSRAIAPLVSGHGPVDKMAAVVFERFVRGGLFEISWDVRVISVSLISPHKKKEWSYGRWTTVSLFQ